MKKVLLVLGNILSAFALFIGINAVNSPSMVIYHQPEIPDTMLKFKK